MKIKGQNLRLFLGTTEGGDLAIKNALDCTLHIAAQVEDSSDKDSEGDWTENEVVGKSWDVSANSLVDMDADSQAVLANQLMGYIINGTPLFMVFEQTTGASGTKNRTKVSPASGLKRSGKCYLTDYNIQSANKQKVQVSIQLTGTGKLS